VPKELIVADLNRTTVACPRAKFTFYISVRYVTEHNWVVLKISTTDHLVRSWKPLDFSTGEFDGSNTCIWLRVTQIFVLLIKLVMFAHILCAYLCWLLAVRNAHNLR
jgi:hypothetical protein